MTQENYEQELVEKLKSRDKEGPAEALGYLETRLQELKGISEGLAEAIIDMPIRSVEENMPETSGILHYLVDRYVTNTYDSPASSARANMLRQRQAVEWVAHAIAIDPEAFYENVGLSESQKTIYHPGALLWFDDLFGYETVSELAAKGTNGGSGKRDARAEIPVVDLSDQEVDIETLLDEEQSEIAPLNKRPAKPPTQSEPETTPTE